MYFQLRQVLLWPRGDGRPRVLKFEPGVVNVISGASKTGKSAVIPIVDYCLGAGKCTIPVGVIRENCSWFGVLVDTIEGQKLLARREPGDQQSTGDMLMLEGPVVDVPDQIGEKNTNVDIVKAVLNRLSGLTGLEFDPASENGFKSAPSFRDLMAFTFQPQNIVANPDIMFFKADTTEHREKLKTIFPYILGAVTAATLQARFELDRLSRNFRRKEAELRAIVSATSGWQLEAQGWLRQAVEFGLLPADQVLPSEWPDVIDLLRQITAKDSRSARPSLAGIEVALSRLERLRLEETSATSELTQHRQRLNELRRLLESSEAYGGAMRVQRDRLSLANWLRNLASSEPSAARDPLMVLAGGGKERLAALCDSLDAIEVRLRSHPTLSNTLDKEVLRQRASAEIVLQRVNDIRAEIETLERTSDEAKETANRYDRMERFQGRLEQALRLYDETDQSSQLRQEINGLREQIEELQRTISEAEIRRKLNNALAQIQNMASRLVPRLDAEWPESPIKLMIDDLTVKVVHGKRDDYLWEIGSGANWLAYHVAMTLALQQFFLTEPHHSVPSFLIYDQPSQVYFPKRAARNEEATLIEWRDQDVEAVRKVFDLLGQESLEAKGRLQIIVLDHADQEVWGDLPNVQLAEEWRGSALVPNDWITRQ